LTKRFPQTEKSKRNITADIREDVVRSLVKEAAEIPDDGEKLRTRERSRSKSAEMD